MKEVMMNMPVVLACSKIAPDAAEYLKVVREAFPGREVRYVEDCPVSHGDCTESARLIRLSFRNIVFLPHREAVMGARTGSVLEIGANVAWGEPLHGRSCGIVRHRSFVDHAIHVVWQYERPPHQAALVPENYAMV